LRGEEFGAWGAGGGGEGADAQVGCEERAGGGERGEDVAEGRVLARSSFRKAI